MFHYLCCLLLLWPICFFSVKTPLSALLFSNALAIHLVRMVRNPCGVKARLDVDAGHLPGCLYILFPAHISLRCLLCHFCCFTPHVEGGRQTMIVVVSCLPLFTCINGHWKWLIEDIGFGHDICCNVQTRHYCLLLENPIIAWDIAGFGAKRPTVAMLPFLPPV